MEAKELIIGRWYTSKLHGKDFRMTKEILIDILEDDEENKYQPIPLTEEWMLKLGFERIDTGHMIAWSINDFHLLHTLGTEPFECHMTFNNDSVTIKYVHQLQNLYFALTNKELQIKE